MMLPELNELLALRGAARSLSLRAHGPARALLLGTHRSHQRGRGLEFEEVRPYVAGDDPRSIDWRVTARRGRVHTKLFREERERPVWLLVDLNPTLFFGSRVQLKSALAVRAAALLAWVAALGGDRIGALIDNASTMRILPPRAREAGVLPILNALIELQPRGIDLSGTSRLEHSLQRLAHSVHPGSLVLMLSDFATATSSETTTWSALSAHSECRWLWITDALEQQGLPDGRFRGGVKRVISVDGAGVRAQWQAAWRQRATTINTQAQALKIALLRLDTSSSVEHTLQQALHPAKSAA